VSFVMVMDEWQRTWLTTAMSTPAASLSDAAPCRRSCSRTRRTPATVDLCLAALNVCAKRAQPRLNGAELPARWVTAIRELEAVARADSATDTAGFADATEPVPAPVPVPRSEQIGTAEAARRLQITPQAVTKRLRKGSLPGQQVGGVWIVEWREQQGLGSMHGVNGDRPAVPAQGARRAAVRPLLDT
jgi:hypothetical protein